MNIWQDFKTNQGNIVTKWSHYFPIYERHLTAWRNKTLTFVEIGVLKGGSLQMWQRFFGPLATIVGIDIDPQCKGYEERGIHVRIGDQSDPQFLESIVAEFGSPDIVVDDASHVMKNTTKSFEVLYPKLSKNGIYIVEDMHTAYWPEFGGGIESADSFVNISKNFIDQLNADHTRGALEPDFMTRHTFGISFYDSVIVIERGTVPIKTDVQSGKSNIPVVNRIGRALTKPIRMLGMTS